MNTIPAAHLRPADVFRVLPDGPDLTVSDTAEHPLAGLLVLTLAELGEPLTLPQQSLLVAVSIPRIAHVPCLLCREDFSVHVDLAHEGVPRCGICGPCNHKTTVAVLGRPAR